MVWICLAASLIFIAYLLLIIFFTAGWLRKKPFALVPVLQNPLISVVVAIRNEEKNISWLVKALKEQTYQNTEIIFINDHSTDNSLQIIRDFADHNFMILNLPENKKGKKEALALGINSANGELIVTTDADCVFNEKWIETIVSFHQNENAEFIMAPVKHITNKSFLQNLFAVDFMSLQASASGASEIHLPFMCNGANLAFTKTLWNKLDGNNNASYSSGDDVFLLHSAIKFLKTEKIKFLFSQDAIVETPAPNSFGAFFNQRIRWAGKSKGYKNRMAILTSLSVFALLIVMNSLLVGSFFSIHILYCLATMLFVKTLAELPMMILTAKFYKEEKILVYFFILQPFYFIYTFAIALFSLFYKYNWKDRIIIR